MLRTLPNSKPYIALSSSLTCSPTSPLLPQQMRKDPYWDPQPYFLGSVVAMVQATRMLRAEAPRGLRNIPIFIIQVRGEGGSRRHRVR